MALFGNALTVPAATAALESAEARLAGFEAERAAKMSAIAEESDFDANLALRDEVAALDRKVAAATDSLNNARRNLETAKAEAAEAEADRRHKAAQKRAREDEKLVLKVGALSIELAAAITELEAGRKIVDEANANRGSRPFIVDAEKRVREVPEKHFPTVWEEIDVWRNEYGHTPTEYRVLENGEHVPKDGGYTKRREKIVSRNERTTPAHMPGGRFAEMKLVGLKGEKLLGR
jgi:hypothetical protein